MKPFILLIPLFIFQINYSQDSTLYQAQARELIQQRQYASAHQLLQSAIQETGFQPELVCLMVENALNNFIYQRDYMVFYLRDSSDNWDNFTVDTSLASGIISIRYLDRKLQKLIREYPQYGKAYKLLGDFYDLQLSDLGESNLIDKDAVRTMEEKIFRYYHKAFQLGVNDLRVNRWLGDYYKKLNQFNIAKRYYLKNTQNTHKDPITYFRLAEIFFKEKKYTQAYNNATEALQNFPPSEIYLRYDALRLAALSLYNLDEEAQFLDYVQECIQLLPDEQDAYIDLLNFYDAKGNKEQMEKIAHRMLLNNPYDLHGYRYFENFTVKYNDYGFAEKLFEEMILQYENSDEVMGNIYWFRGNLLYHQGMHNEAKKMWEISRSYFARYLPQDSPFLKKIGRINHKSTLE